jgi:predicted nucleic acid-binding protein
VSSIVVVDTMIASAWLGRKHSQRKARWAPLLEHAVWVLPFTVVAEMRFGAEVAGWGARRRGVLDRLIGRAGVVPPIEVVTDAYVDLRTWSDRSGHGLGAKQHEADRWVAAVAIAGSLPLASDDAIFDDVPALSRLEPDAPSDAT